MQQECVDAHFLASSKVGTPDPRQGDPPNGQRLIVAWDFPKSVFEENLKVITTVRLWDSTQEVFEDEICRKRDVIAYPLSWKEGEEKRILTYKVQVFNAAGKQVRIWEHHLWTELIEIGQSNSSAHNTSSSVSLQPIQESVTETP